MKEKGTKTEDAVLQSWTGAEGFILIGDRHTLQKELIDDYPKTHIADEREI